MRVIVPKGYPRERPFVTTFISDDGKAYQQKIREWTLDHQKWHRSPHPLRLEMLVCFHDNRAQDIDNRVKVMQDALKYGNVLLDDKQIEELEVRRGPNIKGGVVYARLTEILPDRVGNLQWITRAA